MSSPLRSNRQHLKTHLMTSPEEPDAYELTAVAVITSNELERAG
jgi:hypothetical protein